MKKIGIIYFALLLAPLAALGADYHVREDNTHNTTRDGLTYETAWGGWGEVAWGEGAGNVSGGDTLYVHGDHIYSVSIASGNSGAGSGKETIIRGDGADETGSITFNADGALLTASRNYFQYKNITINARTGCTAIYQTGQTAVTYDHITINGGTVGILLESADGSNTKGFSADYCTFSGCTVAGIRWFITNTNATNLTAPSITNCSFNNCGSSETGGGIEFRSSAEAPNTSLTDLTITGCSFTGGGHINIRIYNEGSKTTYGWSGGVLISGNTITGGLAGVVVKGFDASVWGENYIINNTISKTTGLNGGINIFYTKYVDVYGNTVEDGTSIGIDGNGILADSGTVYARIYKNEVNRMTGKVGEAYSGVAFMVLDAQHIDVYNNKGSGNKVAFHQGGSSVNTKISTIRFINNTLIENTDYGIQLAGTVDTTSIDEVEWRNNIITGDGSGIDIDDLSTGGGKIDEDYNLYNGFSTSNEAGEHNVSGNPILNTDYRPFPGSPAEDAGVAIVGLTTDFANNSVSDPPEIGAYEIQYLWAPRSLRVSASDPPEIGAIGIQPTRRGAAF